MENKKREEAFPLQEAVNAVNKAHNRILSSLSKELPGSLEVRFKSYYDKYDLIVGYFLKDVKTLGKEIENLTVEKYNTLLSDLKSRIKSLADKNNIKIDYVDTDLVIGQLSEQTGSLETLLINLTDETPDEKIKDFFKELEPLIEKITVHQSDLGYTVLK